MSLLISSNLVVIMDFLWGIILFGMIVAFIDK